MTAPVPEHEDVEPTPARPTGSVVDRPVLPDQTRDDLDVGWGERLDGTLEDDERFLRERPPHWE